MRFKDITESSQKCPHCGGPMFNEMMMTEKKDACYYKVKAGAKVWPSAYASGRLVQCRKKGAANYGNKSESVTEAQLDEKCWDGYQQQGMKNKGGRQVPNCVPVAEDSDNKCPPATQNITLNLKNRQKAIDEYGYGPLNPDMPNTKFWMQKVDEWNLDSAEEAKQSLCGNCAAFDVRESTLDCIAQGIDSKSPEDAAGVIDAGDLGYCKFLKFKCASRRTCDAWVTGGPLTDEQGVAEGANSKVSVTLNGQPIGHIERDTVADDDGVIGYVGVVYDGTARPYTLHGYEDRNELKHAIADVYRNRVAKKGVAEGAEQEILFYAKIPDGSRVYARVKDEEQWARLQQQYRGSEIKSFDFRRPDILDWLEARGINLRKFAPGMVQTMYPGSRGLNEFAPGAGDEGGGEDPYKYPKPKRYRRSADYFGQFEADHFDREDFDDATGVFKGYWGSTPIAYFKFANPARTGGDDPGMGWYYEPKSDGNNNTSAAPAADQLDDRKQQELSMIRAFLKSGNRPNPDSQIGRLMKKHGIEEDLSRRGFLRGLGAAALGAVGVGAAGSAQARSTDASRKEDEAALALLAKGMTPEQVAKKLGVTGPNHGQTHQMGGGWATINRAAAQLRRQRQGINEFAPSSSDDDGNDGFSDDTLKQLAAQWYNGDEDPRVESTLAAAGWEIGQDEGYDEGGVFVVQAGDVNGRSYISWPATELEGLAETTDPEIEEMYEAMQQLAEEMAASKGVSVDLVWESFEALDDHMLYETAAWRRKEGKSKKGGLNAKGVASYRRENPGSKLQMAVTTKPSKLKKGSKAAKRRKSFCARMGGVKGPMKKPNGKPTRKALALRKWNC